MSGMSGIVLKDVWKFEMPTPARSEYKILPLDLEGVKKAALECKDDPKVALVKTVPRPLKEGEGVICTCCSEVN